MSAAYIVSALNILNEPPFIIRLPATNACMRACAHQAGYLQQPSNSRLPTTPVSVKKTG